MEPNSLLLESEAGSQLAQKEQNAAEVMLSDFGGQFIKGWGWEVKWASASEAGAFALESLADIYRNPRLPCCGEAQAPKQDTYSLFG